MCGEGEYALAAPPMAHAAFNACVRQVFCALHSEVSVQRSQAKYSTPSPQKHAGFPVLWVPAGMKAKCRKLQILFGAEKPILPPHFLCSDLLCSSLSVLEQCRSSPSAKLEGNCTLFGMQFALLANLSECMCDFREDCERMHPTSMGSARCSSDCPQSIFGVCQSWMHWCDAPNEVQHSERTRTTVQWTCQKAQKLPDWTGEQAGKNERECEPESSDSSNRTGSRN